MTDAAVRIDHGAASARLMVAVDGQRHLAVAGDQHRRRRLDALLLPYDSRPPVALLDELLEGIDPRPPPPAIRFASPGSAAGRTPGRDRSLASPQTRTPPRQASLRPRARGHSV